jgi:hypothetical protein
MAGQAQRLPEAPALIRVAQAPGFRELLSFSKAFAKLIPPFFHCKASSCADLRFSQLQKRWMLMQLMAVTPRVLIKNNTITKSISAQSERA